MVEVKFVGFGIEIAFVLFSFIIFGVVNLVNASLLSSDLFNFNVFQSFL